jgi:hypothetical protein
MANQNNLSGYDFKRIGFMAATAMLVWHFTALRTHAAVIASDSFLSNANAAVAASNNEYQSGVTIANQKGTAGTIGYSTAPNTTPGTTSPVAGWVSGSSVYQASSLSLTNPLTASPNFSSDNGSLLAVGNSNTRTQYRDFTANVSTTSTYYFSALLRENSNSYTGLSYVGLAPGKASGSASPTLKGVDVGFSNGDLTLWASNGTSLATTTLLSTPTVNSTYLAEVTMTHSSGTTYSLAASVYDSTGTLVLTSSPVTATIASGDIGAFDAVVSNQFTSTLGAPATVNYDELRFGTSLADVIAVPEPSSAALLLVGGVLCLRSRRRSIRA